MRFKQYITELFEPAKVSLEHPLEKGEDFLTLPFEIDGHKFQMEFCGDRNTPENDWQASYSYGQNHWYGSEDHKKRYDVQNFEGSIQYKILSTVLGFVLTFLEERQPDILIFTAHKASSKSKTPNTRSIVYSKILDRSRGRLSELGYSFTVNDADAIETLFTITKNDGPQHERKYRAGS